MFISIDHGNKQIKTAHRSFTAGLCVNDTQPFGSDVLQFGGKYYTLSKQRIPYMRDKTVDDRFFILTLFAIAFELQGQNSGKVGVPIFVDEISANTKGYELLYMAEES